MDSIDEALSLLNKKIEETFQIHADYEERIFIEEVRWGTKTLASSDAHDSEY
ncbi:hypothetical protein DPMN_089369 [Dreissena polymorpha]|uniref:Uncharacterized protein n=1 Tax=Dreissena polymorpha TaxID=45954 RepID=A0A9D4KVU1_DREPO|nr:hypothetical protein DPMN_089369 [Dreissena polymorpha]